MAIVNEPLRAALLMLRNQPAFEPFKGYLQSLIDRETRALKAGTKNRALYNAQGAVRALEEVRDFIAEADKLREKQESGGVKTAGVY